MKYQKNNSFAGLKSPSGRVIIGNKVKLREKRLSDARDDYAWQSDPELARLDAAPVLNVSFPVYLLDYSDQLHDPGVNRYPFAVETVGGKHIGNCTCYDFSENEGETQLGIIIGDRNYWDKGYGTDTISTIVNYVFLNTNLQRIYLKTLNWNLRAQKCFQNCGFTPCGQLNRDGNSFVLMELYRKQWSKQQNLGEADKDE
jgi:RimJ/RimL family protein N-acetyltransferase